MNGLSFLDLDQEEEQTPVAVNRGEENINFAMFFLWTLVFFAALGNI